MPVTEVPLFRIISLTFPIANVYGTPSPFQHQHPIRFIRRFEPPTITRLCRREAAGASRTGRLRCDDDCLGDDDQQQDEDQAGRSPT